MRRKFADLLGRSGVKHPEHKTELIFTIFGGLPARALRHPEQERAIITDTIVPVMRRILSDPNDDRAVSDFALPFDTNLLILPAQVPAAPACCIRP